MWSLEIYVVAVILQCSVFFLNVIFLLRYNISSLFANYTRKLISINQSIYLNQENP